MTTQKIACPLCGCVVQANRFTSHQGKGRCRVFATKRDMEARGWVALSLGFRTMLQRAGVPHERAPGEYKSAHIAEGRFVGAGYPRAVDRIWVPRWVKLLLDAMEYQETSTTISLLQWAVREPGLSEAIVVAHVMGGSKAVKAMVELAW